MKAPTCKQSKVLVHQGTQTNYEEQVHKKEVMKFQGDPEDSTNHFTTIEPKHWSTAIVEEIDSIVITQASCFQEDITGITSNTGITRKTTVQKNFEFHEVAYVVKGFPRKFPHQVVMTRLQELKFPTVHCKLLSQWSGKLLKHPIVLMDSPKEILDVTNLCGKSVTTK